MYDFNYHRPDSVEEAVQLLSGAADGTLMGGGMTLIPVLKQRLANPSDVVDLGAISGLSGISEEGGNVVVGATVRTNQREIAADDFFTGMFDTALGDNEIITAVVFPVPDKAGYAKVPNPASRYAIVGVMASQGPAGTRVAVTGAGPCVFRASEMESALGGNFSAEALSGASVSADGLNSDIHASAEYRAHLVGVMARRAVAAAG